MALLEENGKGDLSGISGEIVLEYENEEIAKAIFTSINVDNYQYVQCNLERNKIICKAKSAKSSKLLHTLDDLLSCIIVAEEVYRKS